MRALKALVIGMAVLIFAGVVVLIVGIIDKAGDLEGEKAAPAAGFDTTRIALPAGSVIRETRFDGNRILLRITLADGASRLILIDATTGRRIGSIELNPSP